MKLLDYYDRRHNVYVVAGQSGFEHYERPAAAHAALERREFGVKAHRYCEALRGGPFVQDAEELLGCSLHAKGLRRILEDGIAPHERAQVLGGLSALWRMQQGVNEEGRP